MRTLRDELAHRGLTVWLDEDELRPGLTWQDALEDGLSTSRAVAVLVGGDGIGPWEREEMQAALILAVKDGRPVVPVLLPSELEEAPSLPLFLANRTWVDFRAGYTADSLSRLVWGVTGVRAVQEGPLQGVKPAFRSEHFERLSDEAMQLRAARREKIRNGDDDLAEIDQKLITLKRQFRDGPQAK